MERKEVTGDLRKIHNEEHHKLYNLLRKPKAKKPFERHKRRQQDNSEMGIKDK